MSAFGFESADWRRSFVLGGLVIGQSIPGLLLVTVLPTIYRQNGLQLQDFWIFSLASIPIWFKWLWAPLVDRSGEGFMGRRRSWILCCTLLAALTYAALAMIPPVVESLYLIVAVFFLQRLFMATQDIAVDGYTVDSLNERNRPLASAVIGIADSVAYIAAVAGLLAVYEHFGWRWAVIAAVSGLLVCTLPSLFSEPPSPRTANSPRPSLRVLLRRPDTPAILAVMLIGGFASNFVWAVFGAFLVDSKLTLTDAGMALSLASLPGITIGGLFGSWLMRRLGRHAAMPWAVLLAVLSTVPYILLGQSVTPTVTQVMTTVFVATLLTMPCWTIYAAARFAWAHGEQSATDYTVQSSAQYLGRSGAAASAGFVAAWVGWDMFFVVNTAVILVFGLLYLRLSAAPERRAAGMVPSLGATCADGRGPVETSTSDSHRSAA